MRETNIIDNYCKTQAHVRVCEENKLEEKNDYPLSLKDQPSDTTLETVREWILVCLLVMILHSIKVLIVYCIFTIMHAIGKFWAQSGKQAPKSQTRLIYGNNWAIWFHLGVVDSTQLEHARSVIIQ